MRRRVGQITHTGRRDVWDGWMTRTPFLGCTEATRAATHKTTFCRRPRWCLQCSGKVSGSYLQYSTRYRLLSIYFCHLLASKSTKSSIWRSLYSHLHLLLLVNICWNIPKRLISAFQTLIRYYVDKTRSFRNLHFAPSISFSNSLYFCSDPRLFVSFLFSICSLSFFLSFHNIM